MVCVTRKRGTNSQTHTASHNVPSANAIGKNNPVYNVEVSEVYDVIDDTHYDQCGYASLADSAGGTPQFSSPYEESEPEYLVIIG